MRVSLRDFLANDSTLAAILPGGVHACGEISRQSAPQAFDENGEILPCALVRLGTNTPDGPYPEAARTTLNIYFYEPSGYEQIDQALKRCFELLQGKKILAGVWQIQHRSDVCDQEDQALGCSLAVSRYEIIQNRRVT